MALWELFPESPVGYKLLSRIQTDKKIDCCAVLPPDTIFTGGPSATSSSRNCGRIYVIKIVDKELSAKNPILSLAKSKTSGNSWIKRAPRTRESPAFAVNAE